MFIGIGGRRAQTPEERHVTHFAPPSLGRYCATASINIPRLRRSGISEVANSIRLAEASLPFSR
jgi:hypothetical protein